MNSRDTLYWFGMGMIDGRERVPAQRAPKGLTDAELYMNTAQASPQVAAYWDGFDAAVKDGVAAFIRERRVSCNSTSRSS